MMMLEGIRARQAVMLLLLLLVLVLEGELDASRSEDSLLSLGLVLVMVVLVVAQRIKRRRGCVMVLSRRGVGRLHQELGHGQGEGW